MVKNNKKIHVVVCGFSLFLLLCYIPFCDHCSLFILSLMCILCYHWPFLVAQMVRNLLAMLETLVRSLGWEDLLEKGMATHFSILVWRIPWAAEPGRLQSIGLQRVDTTE